MFTCTYRVSKKKPPVSQNWKIFLTYSVMIGKVKWKKIWAKNLLQHLDRGRTHKFNSCFVLLHVLEDSGWMVAKQKVVLFWPKVVLQPICGSNHPKLRLFFWRHPLVVRQLKGCVCVCLFVCVWGNTNLKEYSDGETQNKKSTIIIVERVILASESNASQVETMFHSKLRSKPAHITMYLCRLLDGGGHLYDQFLRLILTLSGTWTCYHYLFRVINCSIFT